MQKKVKILHCVETLGSGGVEQRRLLLAQRLSPSAYEQHLVCSKSLRGFDQRLESCGVTVYSIGNLQGLTNFRYFRKLYKIVRRLRPDIIHGAVFEGVISAAVIGLVCRVPTIIIEETSDPQNRSWRGNLLMKAFARASDFVVAISPSVRRYLAETVGVPDKKLRLINNGIAQPRIPTHNEVAKLKLQLGITESNFIVGSVGRLRDFHKRFSDLIRATAILKNEIPGLRLLIVGGGEDGDVLKQLAADLEVSENVLFAGYQAEIAPYYACMDVFSLASHMEGFGLVLIEAMNFRLPVVATAVGGIRDIVEHGITGFLVEKHSPPDLARNILALYQDPYLRRQLGEQGFKKAVRDYSSDSYIAGVERLYLEAIDKRRKTEGEVEN